MFVKQIGPFFCLYLFSALLNGRQRVPITDIKYTINSVANWQTVIDFALNHDLLQRQRKKKSLVHFWWRKAIISRGSLGGSICCGRGSSTASFSAFWHQQLLSIDFWALLFWPETPPPLPCGARPTVGDGCVICGKMGPAAAHSLATKHPCNEQPPREGERSARWVNGDSTRKVPSITGEITRLRALREEHRQQQE